MSTPTPQAQLVGAARVVAAVLVRPMLWGAALLQLVRLVPRRWWARPPHLPVPDPEYLRFRAVTAYGDPERVPEPRDVLTWLSWCRSLRLLVNDRADGDAHD